MASTNNGEIDLTLDSDDDAPTGTAQRLPPLASSSPSIQAAATPVQPSTGPFSASPPRRSPAQAPLASRQPPPDALPNSTSKGKKRERSRSPQEKPRKRSSVVPNAVPSASSAAAASSSAPRSTAPDERLEPTPSQERPPTAESPLPTPPLSGSAQLRPLNAPPSQQRQKRPLSPSQQPRAPVPRPPASKVASQVSSRPKTLPSSHQTATPAQLLGSGSSSTPRPPPLQPGAAGPTSFKAVRTVANKQPPSRTHLATVPSSSSLSNSAPSASRPPPIASTSSAPSSARRTYPFSKSRPLLSAENGRSTPPTVSSSSAAPLPHQPVASTSKVQLPSPSVPLPASSASRKRRPPVESVGLPAVLYDNRRINLDKSTRPPLPLRLTSLVRPVIQPDRAAQALLRRKPPSPPISPRTRDAGLSWDDQVAVRWQDVAGAPNKHYAAEEVETDSDGDTLRRKAYHPRTWGIADIVRKDDVDLDDESDEERDQLEEEDETGRTLAELVPFVVNSYVGSRKKTLPNGFRRAEMEEADARTAAEREAKAASAGEGKKKERQEWGDLDHHTLSKRQKTPPLYAKARRTADIDESSENDSSDEDAPTVGIKVIALKASKAKRRRMKERRAEGFISDSEDEEVMLNRGRRVR